MVKNELAFLMIQYSIAKTNPELEQILALQKANLPEALSADEIESQGFVTVSHDFHLLAEMNAKCPHIIAKSNDKIIGYALVMLKDFKDRIPVLVPMFEQIDRIVYNGKILSEIDYFIMGQVCIAKEFRGRGIFRALFEKMKIEMASKYQLIITEVASRNIRSLKAHFKVGFKTINEYSSKEGEEWAIIAWDWQ